METTDHGGMRLELERCQASVEDRLNGYLTESAKYGTLLEAMRYSLLGGGKRIRAVICLKFCEAAGGKTEDAMNAACAVEMLHAYSLIHDDLPCMDNDAMRRGKPSNHVKYGEFTATLAGDALQALAFDTMLKRSGLPDAALADMGRELALAAGPSGICGGQYLDMRGARLTADDLADINYRKTAALISASAKVGVLAAGGSTEQLEAAVEYARAVGLSFQVRDDVLDLISTESELGKPIGSDMENNKPTFASLLGTGGCEDIIRLETEKAVRAVGSGKFRDTRFLVWLARTLQERKY